jgi:hypothetical protein
MYLVVGQFVFALARNGHFGRVPSAGPDRYWKVGFPTAMLDQPAHFDGDRAHV